MTARARDRMDGGYFAEGRIIRRSPLAGDDNGTRITLGFPVATLSDIVSQDAAEALADALNDMFSLPRAYTSQGLGVRDVLAERARQIAAEGFDEDHDDEHKDRSLAKAAGHYALNYAHNEADTHPEGRPWPDWPWDQKWWKPTLTRQDLVKSAALTLAEIARVDRLQAKAERTAYASHNSHDTEFPALPVTANWDTQF